MSSPNNLKPISITEIDDLVKDNHSSLGDKSSNSDNERWNRMNLGDSNSVESSVGGQAFFTAVDNSQSARFAVGILKYLF